MLIRNTPLTAVREEEHILGRTHPIGLSLKYISEKRFLLLYEFDIFGLGLFNSSAIQSQYTL